MYRTHTRTCLSYIFMCVCVCAHVQRADHHTHTHMESKAKHMKLSATATSKALVGKDLPGGWGFRFVMGVPPYPKSSKSETTMKGLKDIETYEDWGSPIWEATIIGNNIHINNNIIYILLLVII